MKKVFSKLIEEEPYIHAFYASSGTDDYLGHVVSYILSGVERKAHVLVIESERLLIQLFNKLEKVLDTEQLSYVHPINNFDYYYSSGSFHPPTIFDYLSKKLAPLYEENLPFQIWAHVEWSSEQQGIYDTLKEFEKEADELVIEEELCLVCVYDEERLTEDLHEALVKSHNYIVKQGAILPSNVYEENSLTESSLIQ